jgi:hypothetical protein
MSRAILDLDLLAELAEEDDGGPPVAPAPPAIFCQVCRTVAPVYRATRVGDEELRVDAHGRGYPAAICSASWSTVPVDARLAAIGDRPRPHPTPSARAGVEDQPLFSR